MTADWIFFLGYGAFFGGLAGWWLRGLRAGAAESRARARELAGLFREASAFADDPEAARLRRLAYDTLYDDRHPEEEWA